MNARSPRALHVGASARGFRELLADLDRLNHILIPSTLEERARWRASRMARALRRIAFALGRLTEDGQLLLVFTVFAAVIAIDVKSSEVYLAWALLVGLLFASSMGSTLFGLRGVEVEIVLPRRVTVGDEATFRLSVHNRGPRDHESLRVRGPFLSWDGSWVARRAGLARLARDTTAHLELRARFRARGEHHLDAFRLQALVPFGLALGPALVSDGARFLVLPRIANVVSLSLPHGRRYQPGGVPRASRTADSRELLGVRPYRFGDPVRDLHARTWARVGEPVVREYREEYFARIGVILDTDLGQDPEAHFEAAISLVAGLVARLERTEALIDVIVLGNTAHTLTVGRGLGTLDRALELLAGVAAEGPFDPTALAARVLPRAASLSCLVLVALRWDEARRAFAAEVRASGAVCAAFVVAASDDETAAEPGVTRVSPERIHAREPIAL